MHIRSIKYKELALETEILYYIEKVLVTHIIMFSFNLQSATRKLFYYNQNIDNI